MGKFVCNKAALALSLALTATSAGGQTWWNPDVPNVPSTPVQSQNTFAAALAQLEAVWRTVISGVRVNTAQTAGSGNQVASTALKAAEANAMAVAQFDGRYGVSEAANKYVVGRDQTSAACGPVELRRMANAASERNRQISSVIAAADQEFLAGNGDAAKVQSTLNRRRAEFYCSQEEFDAGLCSALAGIGYNTGPKAGDTNASVFMNGGASGAEEVATGLDYIDRVAPLPTVVRKTGAASAISRIIALKQGAERSMAREIIGGSIMEGLE